MLLIRPYQWSNLAATAWVSVARRAAPLSCPAVAEINPQIEQSPHWPLQTPKSCCVHPSNRDSLLPQALFFRVGVDGGALGHIKWEGEGGWVCVHEWECVGSGWIEWAWDGQGRGIKMADWACLYFQWHSALRGRPRRKKCTASKAFKCAFFCLLQTAGEGLLCATFSDLPAFNQKYDLFAVKVKDSLCLSSSYLQLMSLKWLIERILTKAPLNPSSYLHCYLSCPSFLGRRPNRSLSGLLLWHTVKQLERNGWSQVAGGLVGVGVAVLGRFGAQCNRSTLSIVNHCHPSEATRLALHAANPLSVSTLAVCRSGREPHQKVLELGIETEWLEGGRMLEKRGGKMCRVEVVGGEGQGHSSLLNPGVGFRVRDGFERICTTQSGGQGGPVFIPPSIPPPFHPPPPAHHHLPASHHQCSQGDERHGEEGPQGINFSHGWESSSQKTWQPQTAWLKKKRREEKRKGGREGTGGGEEGEFFTWWPWERDFGYWVSFFPCVQSPHVLVENEQIVPPVLSAVPVLPGLKMWVGTSTHCWLLNRKPWDVLWFQKKKNIMVEVVAFDSAFHQIFSHRMPISSTKNQNIQSLIPIFCGVMIISRCIITSLMDYQKPSVVLCMSALHYSQGRHWQRESANRCRLKVLVFKWQGALFPLTLSQINWASQVCLWEREDKNQNKRSHWSEDGRRGWLSSLASGSATQPSGTAGHLIPPILSR